MLSSVQFEMDRFGLVCSSVAASNASADIAVPHRLLSCYMMTRTMSKGCCCSSAAVTHPCFATAYNGTKMEEN